LLPGQPFIFSSLAFPVFASSTSVIIQDSTVSCPTLVALTLRRPFLLIVAPITSSPFVLSIGMLSPVIADSSKEEFPSIIIPSVGIRSPDLITIRSPSTICSTEISVSLNSFDNNFSLRLKLILLLLLY
jgi:hypothetical protein